jgi:hypothetical protein
MPEGNKDAGASPKPSEPKPEQREGMQKVDEGVQEKAAEEREKSGGYD